MRAALLFLSLFLVVQTEVVLNVQLKDFKDYLSNTWADHTYFLSVCVNSPLGEDCDIASSIVGARKKVYPNVTVILEASDTIELRFRFSIYTEDTWMAQFSFNSTLRELAGKTRAFMDKHARAVFYLDYYAAVKCRDLSKIRTSEIPIFLLPTNITLEQILDGNCDRSCVISLAIFVTLLIILAITCILICFCCLKCCCQYRKKKQAKGKKENDLSGLSTVWMYNTKPSISPPTNGSMDHLISFPRPRCDSIQESIV